MSQMLTKQILNHLNLTGKFPTGGKTNNLEVIVLLIYLCNFWRTLQILLTDAISCATLDRRLRYFLDNSICYN